MTNKKQYTLFVKECRKWIKQFELNNWKVYFHHEKLEKGTGANCYTDALSYNAHISFSTDQEITNEYIKQFAKHEVLHLLIGRFGGQANSRYVSKNELIEAEEELVIKLETIVK